MPDQHEAIMANVCVACRHTMRDHAWTNEDKCYCLVATCHCSDFRYRTKDGIHDSVEAYDRFRDVVLHESQTLQETPSYCTVCNSTFYGPQESRSCGHGVL